MDNTTLVIACLVLALVSLAMNNFFNARRLNQLEDSLYEAHRDSPEVQAFIKEVLNKLPYIEAIKQVRSRYGLSLKHAKTVVDQYK
ncbi:hypothetical protein [Paenibacillus dauci]|uniref:hypothetical protein n=1 Tax=Paenibacillus dauci TaxID=1567106 RepID=UPI0006193566|nr:hypothetical protein [Paenibacillus dauci]